MNYYYYSTVTVLILGPLHSPEASNYSSRIHSLLYSFTHRACLQISMRGFVAFKLR